MSLLNECPSRSDARLNGLLGVAAWAGYPFSHVQCSYFFGAENIAKTVTAILVIRRNQVLRLLASLLFLKESGLGLVMLSSLKDHV